MKLKFHHVALTVNDLKKTCAWYQDKLGFEISEEYDMYGGKKAILVKNNELRLELFDFGEANKPLPEYRKDLMEDVHVIGTKHLCIEVEDLDEMIQSLKEKGVTDIREVANAGFGGKFTFIKDPSGILIELYQKE